MAFNLDKKTGQTSGSQQFGGGFTLDKYTPEMMELRKRQQSIQGELNVANQYTNKYNKYTPTTLKTLSELQIDPLSLQANPKNVLKSYIGGIGESIKAAWEQAGKTTKETTIAGKAGSFASTVAKTAGVVLSPITSLFTAAKDVPVLGSISKVFSLPFEVIGDAANDISYPISKAIPGLDEKQRETVRQGLSDTISLAGQIVAGGGLSKGGKIAETRFKELVQKYGEKDAQTIITKAQDIVKNSNKEVITQPQQTQPIVEPVVQKTSGFVVDKPTEVLPPKPEIKTTGLGETIQTITRNEKVDMGDFSPSLYETRPRSPLATEFVNRTPTTDLIEIARNKTTPPAGIFREDVVRELTIKAVKEGDIPTLKRLGSDPEISGPGTELGQRIQALDTGLSSNPVEVIKSVVDTRLRAAEKKFGNVFKKTDIGQVKEKSIKTLKTELTKTIQKKQSWSDFVQSIQC